MASIARLVKDKGAELLHDNKIEKAGSIPNLLMFLNFE